MYPLQFRIPGDIYDFGSPNDKTMYETAVSLFSQLDLNAGRIKANTTAFKDSPRDMSLKQDTINALGIYFTDTTEALVRNFAKFCAKYAYTHSVKHIRKDFL